MRAHGFRGRLIGVAGKARSGKSTVAEMTDFTVVALADPIKRAAKEFFKFTDEQCWGSLKDVGDTRYPRVFMKHAWERRTTGKYECKGCGKVTQPYDDGSGPCQTFLKPRHVFQRLGTEMGRECFEDVWVNYLLDVAGDVLLEATYSKESGVHWNPMRSQHGVVVPDVRFANEVAAIRKVGGVIWRCHREGEGIVESHSSETYEIPASDVDVEIDNNGSLDELRKRVAGFMKEMGR